MPSEDPRLSDEKICVLFCEPFAGLFTRLDMAFALHGVCLLQQLSMMLIWHGLSLPIY